MCVELYHRVGNKVGEGEERGRGARKRGNDIYPLGRSGGYEGIIPNASWSRGGREVKAPARGAMVGDGPARESE